MHLAVDLVVDHGVFKGARSVEESSKKDERISVKVVQCLVRCWRRGEVATCKPGKWRAKVIRGTGVIVVAGGSICQMLGLVVSLLINGCSATGKSCSMSSIYMALAVCIVDKQDSNVAVLGEGQPATPEEGIHLTRRGLRSLPSTSWRPIRGSTL